MTAETHGPLVYAIPAEAWAGALIAGASVSMIGLAKNGLWRHSALFVLIGSFWLFGIYAFFVVASWPAIGGALVFSHALALSIAYFAICRVAWRDVRGVDVGRV